MAKTNKTRRTIKPKRNGAAPRRPRRLGCMNTYERAISGTTLRDGDYVELRNQWAKLVVTVQLEDDEDQRIGADGVIVSTLREAGRPVFVVDGDYMPQAKKPPRFDTAGEAFGYCLTCLTYFAEGRLS